LLSLSDYLVVSGLSRCTLSRALPIIFIQTGGVSMFTKRTRRIVGMSLAGAGLSFAFLGIGDLVMDPTEWGYQIQQIAQIANEIQEVRQVKNNVMGTWNQLKSNAQFLTNKNSWRGYFMSNPRFSPSSQNGETEGWTNAAQKGIGVVSAWSRSSERLLSNPSLALGSHLSVDYANAEIGQASTVSALQTLGTARAVQEQMQDPIGHCEDSALSTTEGDNTLAASANIANACQSLILRQGQTGLSIETARLELDAQRSKRETDEAVATANTQTTDQQYRQKLSVGDVATSMKTFVDR
jgi:hypothetical protein